MTTEQIHLVKRSWTLVACMPAEEVGKLFYTRLFELAPHLQHLFKSPQPEQSRKLIAMINYVINRLDSLEDILDEVAKLAQRHVQYGVKEEHYQVVGQALLWTLEKGLDKFWHPALKEAWVVCYTTLSGAMISVSYPATSVA
ncbi:globin domain-containing protein [Paraflavitalea sp. CAU 1676]|uniref:globin domain-containing protein n=1 Tax=Paraflavitalea sp. CAU 1676 TaxID=3032598 RepID=UPI0023DA1080|nr:globin domain-containing protein [Paraflavitalea sp. CAU 1676]MDF2189997.1 globin domain-containing protein [Paraflavitalea sp. CAU 1676]